MVNVCMLQAFEGDFIWLSYGKTENEYHILIDGGTEECGEKYAEVIEYIASRKQIIEAIILTHVDCDHIAGACNGIRKVKKEILQNSVKKILFNTRSDIVKEIYVNSSDRAYGVKEGIQFMDLLEKKGMYDCLEGLVMAGETVGLDSGATLKIISPGEKELVALEKNWEIYEKKHETIGYSVNEAQVKINLDELMNMRMRSDTSVNNGSSIAFLFEYDGIKGAFLGDARPSVCVNGMKKLGITKPYDVDFLKISHHGSMSNTNRTLLKWIQTENYLLSTDGNKGKTPSKAVIAQLLRSCKGQEGKKISVFCNYEWWEDTYYGKYFTSDDRGTYIDTKMLEIRTLDEDEIKVRDGLTFYGEDRILYTGM